jgi:FkbM family methyltransferase
MTADDARRSIIRRIKLWLSMLRFPVSMRHAVDSYSQEGEDMILRRLLTGQRTGFYVDVGAHHPYRFSNTCHFYLRGWRGINIEPNPDALRIFKRRRSRDINLGVGIAESASALTYYRFDEPALNSFDPELVARRLATTPFRQIGTDTIPVHRLDLVLDQYLPKDTALDFLSVDVEGFDLQVLRSNNWERYRPHYVLVEALESSLDSLAADATYQFMRDHGYTLLAKTLNTLIFLDGANIHAAQGTSTAAVTTGDMA